MKTFTKAVLLTALSTSLVLASDINIDSAGINLGVSNTSYSKTDNQGSITLGNNPSKSFTSVELYTTLKGVFENSSIKPYASLTYSSNSDLKHQYLLVGVNKYYKYQAVNFYAGAVAGYGKLKWKYNPLNSTTSNDYSATSFIAGLQGGVEYPINEKFAVSLNTKYLLHNYETQLVPSSTVNSTIEHKGSAHVSIGFKYSF